MNETAVCSKRRSYAQYILAALEYAIVLSFTIPLFLYRQKYSPFFYLRCQSLIKPTMSKYLNVPIHLCVIYLLASSMLAKKKALATFSSWSTSAHFSLLSHP